MSLQIKLLGTLQIKDNGTPSDIMKWSKGCALLVYLLVTGQAQSREAVADLLWDASSTSQSLQNLRKLLSRMRKWVPGLVVTRKQVAYATETSDLFTLTDALASADIEAVNEGLRLYEGDLLDGFYLSDAPRFNDWLLFTREQLRQEVVAAYRRICSFYAEQKMWSNGIDAARRWLLLDPLDEEVIQQLIQMLASAGQREAALEQYALSKQRLWSELGVDPAPAMEALAQELAHLQRESNLWHLVENVAVELPTRDKLAEPGPLPTLSTVPYKRNREFTGRKKSLLLLAERLLPWPDSGNNFTRALAITGMGGLGKTQLAVEFCYRYGRYYPGGVFWLSFAEADNVAEGVAAIGSERGLGLFRETDQLSLRDQVGRVQRAWQEPIPRLLIFDNCEDEDLLVDWLPVTGGCRVLLTSRRGIWAQGLGITAVPLKPLTPAESSLLLQNLAPHLTKSDTRKIGQEIGHLPLALHLAGGFLQRYRQISSSTYLNQLRVKTMLHHPSLQGRGLSYSPTGHELNIVRTYVLSWRQLDPTAEVDAMARRLLTHAACLAPGEPIPAEWLKATVGPDDDDMLNNILLVEDGLSRLLALGFLKTEGKQTIILHRLLAIFTREMCDSEAWRAAQTAVATHMVQTLFALRRRQGHLSTLPFSTAHLRYLLDTAVGRKEQTAVSLATLLGIYLEDIDDVGEAQRVLKKGLLVAEEIKDTVGQAHVLMVLASTHNMMGHFAESLGRAQQAVALFNEAEAPNTAGLAEALYYQACAHYRMGQIEEALSTAKAGHTLSQTANLPRTMASFLNILGSINYYLLGSYNIGQQYLEESLAVHRSLGNKRGENIVLNNMGENARLQGDFELAIQYYEKALAIAYEIQNYSKANQILINLCGARIGVGQYETAVTDLEEMVAKINEDWSGFSESYCLLAEAYLGQEKPTRALAMAQEALSWANKLHPFEYGRVWRVIGRIAAHVNQPISVNPTDNNQYAASTCFKHSLTFFKTNKLERDRALTLWQWAQYELAQGNTTEGSMMWQEAQAIFERLNLPLWLAQMEQAEASALFK